MRLTGFGLEVDLDEGWEGRLFRRPLRAGEETHPVLHLANFPLPDERADFGGGVVEHMASGDCFAALFDYGPDAATQSLFVRRGVPQLRRRDFAAARLQRTIPGQAGAQLFFQVGGRGFCLYAVVGSLRDLTPVEPLNAMLSRTRVMPW